MKLRNTLQRQQYRKILKKSRKLSPKVCPGSPLSRTRSSRPAQQAVFNTAELLEDILIYLPALQLFAIKRVCRQFNDVVHSSYAIRRKQFLVADSKRDLLWRLKDLDVESDSANPSWEPLPADTPLDESGTIQLRNPFSKSLMRAKVYPKVPSELNPLLHLAHKNDCPLQLPASLTKRPLTLHGNATIHLSPDLRLPTTPAAAWRDIHLTDPPCTTAYATLQWRVPEGMNWISARKTNSQLVHDPRGLTLGRIAEMMAGRKARTVLCDERSVQGWKMERPRNFLRRIERRYGSVPVVAEMTIVILGVVFPRDCACGTDGFGRPPRPHDAETG